MLIFILIWQLAAVFAQNKILPPPTVVAEALLASGTNVLLHCAYSIFRLAAGIALAVAIGVPVGIWLGYFKKAGDFVLPLIYMLGPVPKVALLPLIMLIFGIGSLSKIFIIFIIVVFQIVIVCCDAVRNIPEEYFLGFRVVHAKTSDIIRHVVVPAVVPEIFTSLRVGLATSISVLFFAENFGTRYGLGFFIMDQWMVMDYSKMYLGICVMGVMGVLCVSAANFAERRLCPWRDNNKI